MDGDLAVLNGMALGWSNAQIASSLGFGYKTVRSRIKRIFGKQAAANFLKGLFKVIALGAVMMAVLWPERHRLDHRSASTARRCL